MRRLFVSTICLLALACGEDTNPVSPSTITPVVSEPTPTVVNDKPINDTSTIQVTPPELPTQTQLYSIEHVGPTGNECLEMGKHTWNITVTDEEYRLRGASFHSEEAGCGITTEKPDGNLRNTQTNLPGLNVWEWEGAHSCGRYQVDVAIGNEEEFTTIVGVVINTGVDCDHSPPVVEEPEEEEPEVPEEPEPPMPTQGPPVGSRLSSYIPPSLASCDRNLVVDDESIEFYLDQLNPFTGGKICVQPSYTGVGDTATIRIDTPGIKLRAMQQGIAIPVPVVISESDVVVSGFSFSGISGSIIRVDANASRFEIRNNTITGMGTSGICIFTATAGVFGNSTIENNSINNCRTGIYTEDHLGTITIKHNDIYDHVAGIGDLSGAIVQENEFSRNQEAIGYDLDFDPNPAVVNYNNFLTNGDIKNYSSNSILDAENNYFEKGGAAQTIPNPPLGDIDYTPEFGSPAPHR